MPDTAELIARARLICGEPHVFTSATVLSTYRSDGLPRQGPLPLAVVLPGTPGEVASVVGTCGAAGVPFVVRGAGTSHRGGALPVAGAVTIVLTRLRRIIRATGLELTVEAGVPVAALPPPPFGTWLARAEPLGTVGGYLAETAGVENLVGLELVTHDGSRVRFRSGHPGYDLAGAFPGSRGQCGIAVTLTLRARAAP
jgi:glycolate oxidase